MKTTALLLLAASLTGCASNDYAAYGAAQSAIAQSKAQAETARYEALSKIAQDGTDSARVAAVMALALGNQSAGQTQTMAAPPQDRALAWASVLVPSVTSLASMHYASRTAMAAADASARVSESTNAAFVGIAGKIQAPAVPAANVTTTNTTTSSTTSNANQANTTSNANQANTTTSSTANPTTTTTTISGTGSIGGGTVTTAANPTTTTTTTNPASDGKVCSVDTLGQVNCK